MPKRGLSAMLTRMITHQRTRNPGTSPRALRTRLVRWGLSIAVLASSLPLTACQYAATVRNESTKTVVAEIKHDRFLEPETTPATAHLRPGESASLGPFKIDPLEPINLRVRVVGDVFGAWIERRLEPGDQLFVIEDGNLESWEAIRIRLAPLDEPETPNGESPSP